MMRKFVLTVVASASVLIAVGCWEPPKSTPSGQSPTGSATRSPVPTSSTPAKMNTDSNKSSPTPTSSNKSGGFTGSLKFTPPTDPVGARMLREYGAMFVARGVTPPPVVVFRDEAEVSAYQSPLAVTTASVGGVEITLQKAAMDALQAAVVDAKSKGLSLTPRNADAARRNYQQTVENWKSRVEPGLKYWLGKGRISADDVARISALSPSEQVGAIFALEDQGIFFAKNNDKSIIYSVAPPGTSQHLSMLALDISEFEDARVRQVLAEHGWFQTVSSDLPHFTFLGMKTNELSSAGLKSVTNSNREFWVPDLP